MHRSPRPWTRALGGLAVMGALAVGCASSDESAGGRGGIDPSVQGGQTGALMPACGLTAAAERGEPIPAGDGGIVIRLDGCGLGFDPSELTLADADGVPIDFDVETLDDDTVLLRPRVGLAAGSYTLDGMQTGPTAVRVGEDAELPSVLGALSPVGDACRPTFTLALDAQVLEYLPNLKLSASVDGAPPQTWFDYGALDAMGGQARIVLPSCLGGTCLEDGVHELELVAEVAGELGTLEPVSIEFERACGDGAEPSTASCSAGGTRGTAPWLGFVVAALVWRLRRRHKPRPG